MKPQRTSISKLIKAISQGLYERDEPIALAFLSAIAGESMFLLGQPGVGKSLVGRRLKLAFKDASSFEYLMSRFSTPDEIFGPVSISKLKNDDIYERVVEGYLPASDIVFLDEIWKAGPSIQNALLTVLNEKIYRNGRNELSLPLKGVIAASNELPAKNEGLEALWDRFLIRMVVDQISDEGSFGEMITAITSPLIVVPQTLQITNAQYAQWSVAIDSISIPQFVLEIIFSIRKQINLLNHRWVEEVELAPIIISDRRWKKIIRLMRTSALLNDRDVVSFSDMTLLRVCMWDNPNQIEHITPIVNQSITTHLLTKWSDELDLLAQKITELRQIAAKGDDGFTIYDDKYYNIKGVNSGKTFIARDLYNLLSERVPKEFVMAIADHAGVDVNLQPSSSTHTTAKLSILKTAAGVKIDGKAFHLEHKSDLDQIPMPSSG